MLVRRPDGVEAEVFFQKRAPASRPDWIDVATISFPSGRTADEIVPRDAAALAWMANLACSELHPHPVRADDLDHPDELRVDLDPAPGVPWSQVLDIAAPRSCDARRIQALGGRRRPDRAVCTCTYASSGGGDSARCARPPWRRARNRAASTGARDEQVVEGGTPRRVSRLQPERQGPDDCGGVLDPADARRARLRAVRPGMSSTACDPAAFTIKTMPAAFHSAGRSARGHRRSRRARSRCCSSLPRSRRARDRATRRGRPSTRKQPGEAPRVSAVASPSRARRCRSASNTRAKSYGVVTSS